MIEIRKRYSRRTAKPFAHYRRRIVIELEPGDVIAMRLERSKIRYSAPIDQVFRMLALWHARRGR